MFGNNIRHLIDGLDKSFEREYARFDEFSDVVGLSEYKDLIVGLRDRGILIEFDRILKYVTDDSNFDEVLINRLVFLMIFLKWLKKFIIINYPYLSFYNSGLCHF